MPSPSEITPAQLKRLIGTPDAPVIIDVRIDVDFDDDPYLIPSAFRADFTQLVDRQRDPTSDISNDFGPQTVPMLQKEAFCTRLKAEISTARGQGGRRIVIVCQKGRKISQGSAAVLRAEGINAEVLEGGQFAWRDARFPVVTAVALPPKDNIGRTVWVTRHRPKIDRIACPWLIRRFIDSKAKFLFVPPQDVALVAEKFNATPFDVEDVGLSHRAEYCTFDAILETFGLSVPALDTMATIVRGADTNRHDLAPEAAGLLALSLGLSRMYRDDLKQLEAGMLLYDALFRWARDAVQEGHDWPFSTPRREG